MRVLFVSSPGLGHVNPMLPLALAMAARGHDVRWAIAPEFAGHLERMGFQAYSAGLGERERWRHVRSIIGADTSAEGPPPGYGGPTGFATLFGQVSAPVMAESLDAISAQWPPDLFVHDMSELATAPVANRLGVSHVTHSWAWVLPPETFGAAAEFTSHLWTDRGLQPRDDAGVYQHLFLHLYPAGLAGGPPPSAAMKPIRPARVEPLPGENLPDWVDGLGEEAVYVTLGTVFNDGAALGAMVRTVSRLDRELVVTTGPRITAADLGRLPARCHVAAYLPQDAILPHSALVVSHAGAGTFLGAAIRGVPQVCLPQGADQFLNAQVAAQSGIGVALPPDRRGADDILEAARTVLADARYRDRARDVSAQFEAMPSAEDVAPLVEALAGVRA